MSIENGVGWSLIAIENLVPSVQKRSLKKRKFFGHHFTGDD
jgi:hypothetical protein